MSCECDHSTLEIVFRDVVECEHVRAPCVIEVVGEGPQGPAGAAGSDIDVLVNDLSIPAGSPITVTGHLANSNNLSHYGKVVGITRTDATLGNIVSVATDTELVNSSWSWFPASVIFLNGTSLSVTPPTSGFSQQLALAKNAETIVVQLEPSVLL